MAREKILVIDDDDDVFETVQNYLETKGFRVFAERSGLNVRKAYEEIQPDLIITEVILSDLDGFELCQSLRKYTEVPILFYSSVEDDMQKIVGLGVGGDDYILKTVSIGELEARIKAHIRRNRIQLNAYNENKVAAHQDTITYPGLIIDLKRYTVRVDDELVPVSAKEFHLLQYLAQHPNEVFSVDHLFHTIWGESSLGDNRTVMVHISNLRKKIETDPANPKYIKTIRGIGYKFSDVGDSSESTASVSSEATL